jgi:hypothetical protein
MRLYYAEQSIAPCAISAFARSAKKDAEITFHLANPSRDYADGGDDFKFPKQNAKQLPQLRSPPMKTARSKNRNFYRLAQFAPPKNPREF